MAIQMGKTGQSDICDINMTPMIDVLLVLIVIFMIATPMMQKSIDVQLPLDKPSTNQAEQTHIVLEMKGDGTYLINTQPVTMDGLHQRLVEIYTGRPDKILFIKAEPDVIYQDVITAMDRARGAGVLVLGAMLPPKVQQQGS